MRGWGSPPSQPSIETTTRSEARKRGKKHVDDNYLGITPPCPIGSKLCELNTQWPERRQWQIHGSRASAVAGGQTAHTTTQRPLKTKCHVDAAAGYFLLLLSVGRSEAVQQAWQAASRRYMEFAVQGSRK